MAMPHYTADTIELVKPKLEHLERMGYQVGCQLGERYSRKKVRFEDTLDAVKFLCKDFWTEVFKKQVDNLKTNHRGVFVLYDGRFRWLRHCSGRGQPGGSSSAKPTGAEGGDQRDAPAASTGSPQGPGAANLLRFPCGLIRGALASLGVKSQVSADVASALPACSFTVKIQGHQQKKK